MLDCKASLKCFEIKKSRTINLESFNSGCYQLMILFKDNTSIFKKIIKLSKYKKVDLNSLAQSQMDDWNIGDTLLLSGTIITGRDAAHKRLKTMIESGEGLPEDVNFDNKFIYYVGPVDAVRDEVIGPAGPTTASRMDKFTDLMLENTGILGMIGKAERGQATVESIKKHKASYLIAVGGAAYLISKSIKF